MSYRRYCSLGSYSSGQQVAALALYLPLAPPAVCVEEEVRVLELPRAGLVPEVYLLGTWRGHVTVLHVWRVSGLLAVMHAVLTFWFSSRHLTSRERKPVSQVLVHWEAES